MVEQKPHLEIASACVGCFTDDGTLDLGELDFLLGIALRDGVIDDDEKRVLGNIFRQVSRSDVSQQVWDRITEVKARHGIA